MKKAWILLLAALALCLALAACAAPAAQEETTLEASAPQTAEPAEMADEPETPAAPDAPEDTAPALQEEKNPEDTVSRFFQAFAAADYETMKRECTQSCVDTYFHEADVFGVVWAEAQTIGTGASMDDGRYKVPVDVKMETAETSALYPATQTTFFVVLTQQEGDWRVDEFVTG